MLKMLIVEDEKLEREGLLDFLDWKSFGITSVETANDGIDGYEKAKDIRPDIIITDIKMPGMDGIIMSKKIKEFLPDLKIIILTGYDDFRLAKEAINFSANAYILKPLDEEELIPIIHKVVNECKKEIEKAEKERKINSILDESLSFQKAKYLSDLIEGKTDGNEIQRRFSEFRIKLTPDEEYCIFIIRLIENIGSTNFIKNGKQSLLSGILEAIESIQNNNILFCLVEKPELQIKCCISLKQEEKLSLTFINNLLDLIRQATEMDILIGLGKQVKCLEYINLSYSQAVQAIEHGVFRSISGIIDFNELEAVQKVFFENSGDFLVKSNYFTKQLLHAIRLFNEERLLELLDEMFFYIDESLGADRKFIVNNFQNIINETSLFLYTLNRDFDQSSIEKTFSGVELLNPLELRTMKTSIKEFFTQTLINMNDKKNNKDLHIVKQVAKLIDERYMLDINLKSIARDIYLSPNYLGSLFKKCSGKSFNDYLCEYRMEKAKELLESPKNKVSTVAVKVGIPNTSYFCTIFKETYGIAPGEYQETLLRNKHD